MSDLRSLLVHRKRRGAHCRSAFGHYTNRSCLGSGRDGCRYLPIGVHRELGRDIIAKADSRGLREAASGDRHRGPYRSARRIEAENLRRHAECLIAGQRGRAGGDRHISSQRPGRNGARMKVLPVSTLVAAVIPPNFTTDDELKPCPRIPTFAVSMAIVGRSETNGLNVVLKR